VDKEYIQDFITKYEEKIHKKKQRRIDRERIEKNNLDDLLEYGDEENQD
jgi:hypothetical protein